MTCSWRADARLLTKGQSRQKWLGGKSKQEALSEAQEEIRAEVKKKYRGDFPFFWGAFVLVGR